MTTRFARRMEALKASEIREILKVTQKPEVISFAGGLPAPELFPVQALAEVTRRILQEEGGRALQYSTTEGHPPLRSWIAARMAGTSGVTGTRIRSASAKMAWLSVLYDGWRSMTTTST